VVDFVPDGEVQARFRVLAEHTSDVVLLFSAKGTVVWASPSLARVLGLKPDELVATQASLLHPDDSAAAVAQYTEAVAGRRLHYRNRLRCLHADGSVVWVDNSVDLWWSPTGELLGATASMRDVSSEVAALAALADSERRYRLLAEHASEVVAEGSNDGIMTWVSPSITAAMGYRPDELVGTPFLDLVHPDDHARVVRTQRNVRDGRRSDLAVRLLDSSGAWRPFDIHVNPVRDESGAVIGRVACWRDAEDRVMVEDALDHERRRKDASWSSMLDPLVIFRLVRDATGEITNVVYLDANPAALWALGVERDDLVGRRLTEVTTADTAAQLLGWCREVVATGRPLAIDEVRLNSVTAGGPRWYDVRAVAVGNELTYTWRDVTARRERAEQLAANEERYRLLAENAGDVVIRTDSDGLIAWISSGVTRWLGWDPQDLVGTSLLDLVRPEQAADFAGRRRDFYRGLDEMDDAGILAEVRTAAGEYRWMSGRGELVRDDAGRSMGAVGSLRAVDELVRARQELEALASTDSLTGMLTRAEGFARLRAILAHPPRADLATAVLYCDLDRFKRINDARGHAVGDDVLVAVAARVRACVRGDDLVVRLGGDEILVVLTGVRDLSDAMAVAETLRSKVSEPLVVDDEHVDLTVSVGVALAEPDEQVDLLVARADAAMYRAKEAGRDRVVPTGPELS